MGQVRGVLFDLEGVLLEAKTHRVLPGAQEIVTHCREQNLPYGIISNNTMKTSTELLDILSERGLEISEVQLLTPLKFLQAELQELETALVIGSERRVLHRSY